MKSITTNYRKNFKCIGGACSFTCCQQWDISVDKKTMEKWQSLHLQGDLKSYASYVNPSKHAIRLLHGRCPFLNGDQLCQMVVEQGESVLSKTCDLFPRQDQFFRDQAEYTVTGLCPVVIDMFRNQAFALVEGSANVEESDVEDTADLELLQELRRRLISFVLRGKYPLAFSLRMLFYILRDIEERYYADADWMVDWEAYFSDESLTALAREMEKQDYDYAGSLLERNELLLDLTYNYEKQGYYPDYLARFLPMAKQISRSKQVPAEEKYQKFLQDMEIYDDFFRNYLANELFTSLLKPLSDMQSATVMLQWIAMEYAMIVHAAFLQYVTQEKREDCDGTTGDCQENCMNATNREQTPKTSTCLPYEDLRDTMVLMGRMTGYGEDDIFDYLENNFADLLWPFSYLHRILP